MTIRDYSTTPANNNAAPPNGFPEGQAASTVNDCSRQLMAEVRESFEELPYFDFGDDPTRVDNDTFTLVGDLTARYAVGARVKLVGATTGFGRITASAFGAVTTIDVLMDSGNVPTSLVRVAVSSTGVGANPTGTIGLTAVNGTASTLVRSDGAPALSQAIAPTWTDVHIFANVPSSSLDGSMLLTDTNNPLFAMRQSGAPADNKVWDFVVSGEAFLGRTANDAGAGNANWLRVDRTGTVVDSVAFPTDAAGGGGIGGQFRVGTNENSAGLSNVLMQVRSTVTQTTAVFRNSNSTNFPLAVHNEGTSSDNGFIYFGTEAAGTARGSINYNRGGGVVAYNTTSDRRLKDNIRDSPSALNLIANLRVRAFDWKGMPGSAQRYWLVAQEVAEVMPEVVTIPETEEGLWSLDVSKLGPLTIKCVQELQAQLQSLATRLTAIEKARADVAKP